MSDTPLKNDKWWERAGATEAEELIRAEALRRGETPPSHGSGHGSGWWIELPRYVASIVREHGVEKAAAYVEWVFDVGSEGIDDAFDRDYGLSPDRRALLPPERRKHNGK